jgi:hypothetical protein
VVIYTTCRYLPSREEGRGEEEYGRAAMELSTRHVTPKGALRCLSCARLKLDHTVINVRSRRAISEGVI